MGSIAADIQGNVALGYSTSNATSPNFPSIKYSGRLAGDPLNTLPQTETTLVSGVDSQTGICGGAAVTAGATTAQSALIHRTAARSGTRLSISIRQATAAPRLRYGLRASARSSSRTALHQHLRRRRRQRSRRHRRLRKVRRRQRRLRLPQQRQLRSRLRHCHIYPTATATATATATFTPTPTATATFTPTPTPEESPTPTATATFTPTPTATATFTPTPTATATFTPTPTATATATATATPTAGPIQLHAQPKRVHGINAVMLKWRGATSTNMDVYRNNVVIVTTPNNGHYNDSTGTSGQAMFTYKVCEAGTGTCSNNVTVNFPP